MESNIGEYDISKLPEYYLPVVYKIKTEDDIMNHDPKPDFSENIDYPKFSLGFQHYIHQSKSKMEITKEFQNKKKVYYVINKFERSVDDYDKDIYKVSKDYFEINPKPNILSRAFYKLWELFFMFDLIDLNENNFVSAHLAEGPGSFTQATMFYRDKFSKKGLSKNDKYYAVTLHAENIDRHVPKLDEKFIDYYKKEKPIRFELHQTYPKQEAGGSSNKDNGDLTNFKTINLFGGKFETNKANFITADGGFDWDEENIQEQEAFKLILAQMIMAFKIQKKGGHFVCKFYETFTNVSSKFLSILTSFYKDVYLIKPLMSRTSNSEKYAVCMDFKYDDSKERLSKISKLEKILHQMNDEKYKFLVDIFPEYNIDANFKSTLIRTNIDIANNQFISINEMITFIEKQNYRGDEYQNRRQLQIDASRYWIDKFFPDIKEFNEKRNKLQSLLSQILQSNDKKISSFNKKLDFS